jgi:hypothetical protein
VFRTCVCGALIAMLYGVPGPASASFVASPMEHHLTIPAGLQESAVVTVSNTGQRPLTLKLYLADSRYSADWQETDQPPGSLERSCAPWCDLSAGLLEIGPGEVRKISFSVNVPQQARGSYWTKLYIEEISTPETLRRRVAGRSYAVFMKQRMGVRIWEDVPGTENPDALVNAVAVAAGPKPGGRTVRVGVENTGNSVLQCQGRIELRGSDGRTAETLPLGSKGEFILFPQGQRNLTAVSDLPLPPGTYTALAVIDFGGNHLVAGEEIFRVDGEGALTQDSERER